MASKGSNANTFDAGVFGSLRYNFTAFGGVAGIIPDPSDELLDAFNKGYRDLLKEYGVTEDGEEIEDSEVPDLDELEKRADKPTFVQQQQDVVKLIAELCQDSPSEEQIMKLPFRVRQKFVVWLQRQLVSPEA